MLYALLFPHVLDARVTFSARDLFPRFLSQPSPFWFWPFTSSLIVVTLCPKSQERFSFLFFSFSFHFLLPLRLHPGPEYSKLLSPEDLFSFSLFVRSLSFVDSPTSFHEQFDSGIVASVLLFFLFSVFSLVTYSSPAGIFRIDCR